MASQGYSQISICLDRALHYEAVLKTKYTLDLIGIVKCCEDHCYARVTRLSVAQFRVGIIHHLNGTLTGNKIRCAITSEVRKRSKPRTDGCFEIDTHIGEMGSTCLLYFYRVTGLGYYAMETIFLNAWDMSEVRRGMRYDNDTHLRSLARIANKIRQVGNFHPVDASIMIPPSETRSNFLRSGNSGRTIVHRRTLKAFFGAAVRVHKASTFMRCTCCIAMKEFAEDRIKFTKDVEILSNSFRNAKANVARGTFVAQAARKLAGERLRGKKYTELRNNLLAARRAARDEMLEGEEGIEEYVDAEREGEGNREVPRDDDADSTMENGGPLSTLESELDELHLAYLEDEVDTSTYLQNLKVKVKGLASMENAMKRFHYKCVSLERVLAYTAQEAAASCPEEVCTLILDGCGKERTKIPIYPQRPKGFGEDGNLSKCPLIGIQQALPAARARGGAVFASDFELHTIDYVIALEWTTVGGADLYASILLDFLYKKTVVPRVLVLILDNAPVNKGEPIMTWLAFIMMRTEIDEIHVFYPSTGHTHTTLDAHFGKVKPKDAAKKILTPQDLKRHLETLPRTRAVLDFAMYEVADKMCSYAHSYSNRLEQHHYVLFKNDNEVMFKYTPMLRFAEFMSTRVVTMLESHSHFLYMTEEERMNGIPVFRKDDGATAEALNELAAQCFPSPWEISNEKIIKLAKQIPRLFIRQREQEITEEFKELKEIAKAEHGLSLSGMLDAIKAKAATRIDFPDDEDASRIVDDLMQNMKFQKRGLTGASGITKAGDANKIRIATTKKVLEILKPNYSTIKEDFVRLARNDSNGRMAVGYKAIVEELECSLDSEGPSRKRKAVRDESAEGPSRGGSMAPPAPPAAHSLTPSPQVAKRVRQLRGQSTRSTPDRDVMDDEDDNDDAASMSSAMSAGSSRADRHRARVINKGQKWEDYGGEDDAH